MSFVALSGAVLSLLKTIIGAGAECSALEVGGTRGGRCSYLAPLKCKARRNQNVPAREGPAGVFYVCFPLCALVRRPAGSSCCTMRCGRRTNEPPENAQS